MNTRPNMASPGLKTEEELLLVPYVDFDISEGTKASEVDLNIFEQRVVALAKSDMDEEAFSAHAIQDGEGDVVGVRLPYATALGIGRIGLPKYFGGEGIVDEHQTARRALVVACVVVQGMVQPSAPAQNKLPAQRAVSVE